MSDVTVFEAGHYRFIPSVFQYSAGVVAEGFERIKAHLEAEGVPLTRFCACELRSPGQFTDDGFRAFNELYVKTLKAWDIMRDDVINPVARSNVCPEVTPPPEPSFHAFSYVVANDGSHPPTAVTSGGAEAREGAGPYAERIVRYGETGPEALNEKALFVVDEMLRRLTLLGFSWADVTAVQAYSVMDFHHVMAAMADRGALEKGLTWHYARPPVLGLDYEMDARVVSDERIVA